MDVERLLGMVLRSGLSTKSKSKGKSKGFSGMVKKAAFSKEGLTLLAGIGMAAYEHFRGAQAAPTPPTPAAGPATPPPFPGAKAAPPPFAGARALPGTPDPDLLLLAMVTAAKADGVLDPSERAALLEHLLQSGAGAEERALLDRLLAAPMDLDALVARVTDPVTAAEVYAASRLAIEPDLPVERAYLAELARRLGLDAAMVAEIEARLDEAAG